LNIPGLEHQRRIERRAPGVGAVQRRRQIVNEREIDRRLNLAKKVIGRNQLIKADDLKRSLNRARATNHAQLNQKPLAKARGLSAVWPLLPDGLWRSNLPCFKSRPV
jgi:hypothetical protein